MSPAPRACLAAEILDGTVTLESLTIKSVATTVGVSVSYVHAALRATSAERQAITRGQRPLLQPQVRALPAPRLIDWVALDCVDDAALTDFVRKVGIDRTLQAAVAAERSLVTTNAA
jgi:hypothetical protein